MSVLFGLMVGAIGAVLITMPRPDHEIADRVLGMWCVIVAVAGFIG